jgi:hypothetical protein
LFLSALQSRRNGGAGRTKAPSKKKIMLAIGWGIGWCRYFAGAWRKPLDAAVFLDLKPLPRERMVNHFKDSAQMSPNCSPQTVGFLTQDHYLMKPA